MKRLFLVACGLLGSQASLGAMGRENVSSLTSIKDEILRQLKRNAGAQAVASLGLVGNVDFQDIQGLTLLHYAALHGSYQMCELLFDRNARHDIKDLRGKMPMDYAREQGHDAIMNLIRFYDGLLDKKDEELTGELFCTLETNKENSGQEFFLGLSQNDKNSVQLVEQDEQFDFRLLPSSPTRSGW